MLTRKPRVVFLGALPPPYMGPTLATEVILHSRLTDRFELIHLDTSDHRDIDTLGAFDFQNIYLALKAYVVMLTLLLREWPDLVYIPISQTTVGYLKDSVFIVLSKLFRRKVVCHLRGGNWSNWLAGTSALTKWYVRKVHSMVDGQIVLGKTLRALFADILPGDRIFVVPNGKDVECAHQPRSGSLVRLTYLANMIRTKGVLDVLYAVPLVVERCPHAEFCFGGAWEDMDLRREIETFLATHPSLPIRWVGTVTGQQKYDLLSDSDIFLFPTYYPPEGHPWVIVEAMAAGLPIIATDQGAIRESVIDGQNGYLIEKRNPAMLAEQAIKLIEDGPLRHRMGTASRELYEDNFTEARMVERLGDAFCSVVTRTGKD